jgi:glutamine synthetase
MNAALRNFLEIPYDELENLNLDFKRKYEAGQSQDKFRDQCLKYLKDESRIKAITVCFSNLEGRFHMLDYDKKFIIDSYNNLTFDGSSVRGFSEVHESDLRLEIDWSSFRWMPSDVFGSGKVIVFGLVKTRDGEIHPSDFRGRLKQYCQDLAKEGLTANIAVECEGFLFQGANAEQKFRARDGFALMSGGGYYHSLPKDPLRQFIDAFAESQRALGFENEKDHPEVAPSQFELNYKYCDALLAADQIQLYKLLARQVADSMNATASFLPKPIAGINGSGMHTNLSISKQGKNLFYSAKGEDGLSDYAWKFVDRLLYSANDLCLIFNSSVNAYRRLDPNFEAPNQIKSSAVDRTSMVRIPLGNEKSARIEVRTVAPDANPYLTFYSILETGLKGPLDESSVNENRRARTRLLPGNIYDSMRHFKSSEWTKQLMTEAVREKFLDLKAMTANRCARELGTLVKTHEILFHHEVTNQLLWTKF